MMTITVFLLILKIFEISCTLPSFTLNAERSIDGSPSVSITFPNGYTDTLALTQHFGGLENDEEVENCNYIGHLVNETEACVAMTGCPGQDDLQFTILSMSLDSPMYVWKKDGSVEVIANPSNLRAEEAPKVDDDIVIDDPEEMAKEFIIEKFCWGGWGWSCKPKCEQKSHLLQFRVGYDDLFRSKAGGDWYAQNTINQAFTHVQAYYCLASLGRVTGIFRFSSALHG